MYDMIYSLDRDTASHSISNGVRKYPIVAGFDALVMEKICERL